MRFRFTIAGMLRFSVLIGLLCALGATLHRIVTFDPPMSGRLAASADGDLLVVYEDGLAWMDVWQTKADRRLQTVPAHLFYSIVAISPDGQRIVGCGNPPMCSELWIRDGAQFRQKVIPTVFNLHDFVAVSHDCRLLVTDDSSQREFSIWSLDDGALRAICKESPGAANASFHLGSADLNRDELVVGYDDGRVDVFDAASGRLKTTIATGHNFPSLPTEIKISPDGRWVFSIWKATTSQAGNNYWAAVIDLEAGKVALRMPLGSATYRGFFSQDSHSFALLDESIDSLQLYDVPPGQVRGALGRSRSVFDAASLGSGRWALATGYGVELWREGAMEPDSILGGDTAGAESGLVLLLLGLGVWLVVEFGIRAHRGRMLCSVCGHVRFLAKRKPKPICLACAQQSREHRPWRSFLFMFAGLGLAAVVMMSGDWFAGNRPDPTRILLLALLVAAFAAYLAIYIAVVRWRYRRLQSGAIDLRRVRRITGCAGQLSVQGSMAVWTAGKNPWLTDAGEAIAAAVEAFSQLTGQLVEPRSIPRILGFERWRQFDEYLRIYGINAFPWPGVYLQAPVQKMILSAEGARTFLIDPASVVRSICTLWFLESVPQLQSRPWLAGGLNLAIMYRGKHALLRRKMSALACEGPLGASLQDGREHQRMLRWRRWQRPDDYARLAGDQFERGSFCCYLAGEEDNPQRRERFRRLLRELVAGATDDAACSTVYGANFAQTVDQWRAWVSAQPLSDLPLATSEQRQILVAELLPLVRNPQAPLVDRLRVIRGLAHVGVPLAARELVALLADQDPSIQATAAWALAMISGERHGDDPAAWREWCESLPADDTLCAAT